MATEVADTRVSLTKGQFVQVFRWHKQLPMRQLATLTGMTITELATLEQGEAEAIPEVTDDKLAALLGCTGIWERVGVDPGFPGTLGPVAPGKAPPKAPSSFAEQINRIASMPDGWRERQLMVIKKELGYIDVS